MLPGFVRVGKQLGAEARELARHQALLAQAQEKLAQSQSVSTSQRSPRAA